MPAYTAAGKPDTSVQAMYIATLIGVGILSLGFMVLGGVLFRRWRRRKMDDMEQGIIKGVPPGPNAADSDGSTPTSERSESQTPPAAGGNAADESIRSSKAVVPAAVVPKAPEIARGGRGKGAKIRAAAENRSQAERIKKRLANIGQEDEEDEGTDLNEPGAGAGVVGGTAIVRRAAELRGGGGALVLGMGGSGRTSPLTRTPSPGDELYGDRRTAQTVFGRVATPPGSAGSGGSRASGVGSRGPTPPEGRRSKGPSPRPGIAGAGTDSRPNSTGFVEVDFGEAEPERWEDGTGIRIDDILAEAKAAASRRDQLRPQPPPWKVASVGTGWGGRGGAESRASSVGSKVIASGPGGVVAAGEGSGSGSGSGEAGAGSSGSGDSPQPSAADNAGASGPLRSAVGTPDSGSVKATAAIAPHLSARLGMTGAHALPPRAPPSHRRPVLSSIGSNPPPPPPREGGADVPRRTVALMQYPGRDLAGRPAGRDLPRAGQAGVPPPPARPLPRAGEGGVPPPPPGRPRGKVGDGGGSDTPSAAARPAPVEVVPTMSPGPLGSGAAESSRPGGQGRDGRGMTSLRPKAGASPTSSPPDGGAGF